MNSNPLLNQLNSEQNIAVSQIEGPVMVIAGPGTGKTQILASRVAHILQITDSSAQNILCLTYTDAGTIAMRKRLLSLIGHDAHRVAIHTFHGFCNRVIQENQDYFDYKDLDAVTDLEKIEYLSDIAIHLNEKHPLKKMKGNVGYLVDTLSKLFDWMKKENVSATQISTLVEQKKKDMLEGDEYLYKRKSGNNSKGDLNTAKYQKEEKKLDDLEAAANLFGAYDKIMADKGMYDYADMILWVINLFQKKPEVLADYQEQFQYILVDEFQDTSGSQNGILNLLLSYWDTPNVFVVGDDDQSIFRFQGAEVKNVMDFATQYGDHLKSVLLLTNYRSTQHILTAAKQLIDNNKERLVNFLSNLDKNLDAASGEDGNIVQIVELENAYLEAIWVVEDIKKHIEKGEKPQDFAVIYSNHAHGDLIGQLLHSEKISVYLKRSQNVLETDTVRQIIQILKYLVKEHKYPFSADFELYTLLHYPYFNITSITLARLAYYINKNRTENYSWRNVINQVNTLPLDQVNISSDQIEEIQAASNLLEELLTFGATHAPNMIVRKVLELLKLSQGVFDNDQFAFELESIITFLNFTDQECAKSPATSIEQLLHKLELMAKHRISLSKENIVYDKKGVNMLTAHSSKGLEFKHVYLIKCIDKSWEKRRNHGSPFGVSKLFSIPDEERAQEELRRLFYVAMTRAERHLTISYFSEDTNGKALSRSMFVDEVLESSSSELKKEAIPNALSIEKLTTVFAQIESHKIDILDPPFLDDYLESYKLSVSHLNSYLECPTRFYFQNVLRVPSQKNVYMSFGIAVHNALDQIVKILDSRPTDFTSSSLQDLYTYYLKKERSVFTEKEFEDFLSLGKSVLSEYIQAKSDYWTSIEKIATEVKIDRVEVDGVPIKGQLDKIEFNGKTVNVVDYKTGDAVTGSRKIRPPVDGASPDDSVQNQYGGPYWRQIMFYSLLVNNDKTRDYTMISGEMDFVEPAESGEFMSQKVMINNENEAQIRGMVKTVYQRIRNKEFAVGCMKPDCYWCSFSKNYHAH
ncbi:MAG: DNA helicase-2/ATP-dependent DNA helicase PcrA [Bacteroidia bacterium]|jgi:DNA helicase-2/ATP-dependent DNA helicase PcrA